MGVDPKAPGDEATLRAGALNTDPADPAATLVGESNLERSQELSVRRGAAVGRYLVVERLGSGAMGVVFRAYDPDLDRSVALKLVATDELAATAADGERSRLMREAQAIARLSHPNVVTVYDVGTVGESVYVAMEYIAGVTLRGWKDEEHTLQETLEIFAQAGRGLAAAHRAGLVHRDFKPDNVMIVRPTDDPDSRVRVLDFGLARMDTANPSSTDTDRELAESHRSDPPHSLSRSMTAAGTVMGTPAYMSPEQHMGRTATAASDQFSFCVALFESLYGQRPFTGKTMATLATQVLAGEVAMPDDPPPVPDHVRQAIERGLSTHPEERFDSMDDLLLALLPPKRSRTVGWVVAGLGGAAIASVVTLAVASEEEEKPSPLCRGAEPKMAQVWNGQARQRLARDFESTGRAYATDVWTATASILDERAEDWIAGHTEACEATRLRGEQSEALLDQRIACYDRQLQRTEVLLEALHDPDDDTLRSAIDAALALPPVQRCADVEALRRDPSDEVPPELREQVTEIVARLDAADTQLELGHFDAATEALGTAVEDARAAGHAPTLARALWLHAELVSAKGDLEAGVAATEEAFAEAIAAGDDRLAGDLARSLAFDWGSILHELPTARRWLAIGRAQVRRLGGAPEIEASLWSSEGAIEVAEGDYAAALAAHQHALDYWEDHGPRSASLARVLSDIGAVHVQLGDAERAAELHRRAVEIKETLYGSQHPETAAALRELGNALSQAEKYDEAIEALQRSLDIERKARGEAARPVAVLLDDIGRIERARGKLDEAVALHRQALEVWEAALGDPHPDLAVSILGVGYSLSAAGKFEEALAEFERALKMFQATVGPEHAYVVYASNSSASALIDLGRYDEAMVHIQRVLDMKNVQADPTLIAETQFMGANALWGDGHPSPADAQRAKQLAREARDAYAAGAERWKPWVERIDTWLAEH